MERGAGLLARGPWEPDQVAVRWRDDEFQPRAAASAAADAAIAQLRERGSPSHDGLGGRLARYRAEPGRLELELQPARWSLRLGEDAAASLSALCVARDPDGRWLAGRRAGWPRGPGAGRWAPAAPSSWASTRWTRWAASCGRSGRSLPIACRWRRWCASPAGWSCWWGWPRSRPAHRWCPTTSTTTSPGGRPRS